MARKRPLTELKEEIAATGTQDLVKAAFLLRENQIKVPNKVTKLVYVIRELRGRMPKDTFYKLIDDLSRVNQVELETVEA